MLEKTKPEWTKNTKHCTALFKNWTKIHQQFINNRSKIRCRQMDVQTSIKIYSLVIEKSKSLREYSPSGGIWATDVTPGRGNLSLARERGIKYRVSLLTTSAQQAGGIYEIQWEINGRRHSATTLDNHKKLDPKPREACRQDSRSLSYPGRVGGY